MKDAKISIGEILARVFDKAIENNRKPREYGLKRKLYSSEIHMIMMIGQSPGLGVTRLAEKAGVTRGAVSQMIQKLETKRLVRKRPDPESGRQVTIELTRTGRIACDAHERMHNEQDRELITFVESLDPAKLSVLKRFLELVECGIDRRANS